MDFLDIFEFIPGEESEKKSLIWYEFLKAQNFNFSLIKKINFINKYPTAFDIYGNKFCINFVDDKKNYHKKKSSLKLELIARALGSGRSGMKVFDLSAGLGIDAIFLSQLGFEVTAIERNPLIYLALKEASDLNQLNSKVQFLFDSADNFLQNNSPIELIYFDPMFPEKIKSALPRQEMVFFKNLVGQDLDAEGVLKIIFEKKQFKRLVVKRPLKAPFLYKKPQSQIQGKLIRFDIYGGHK